MVNMSVKCCASKVIFDGGVLVVFDVIYLSLWLLLLLVLGRSYLYAITETVVVIYV